MHIFFIKLKHDHNKFHDLVLKLEQDSSNYETFRELSIILEEHCHIENNILYTALAQKNTDLYVLSTAAIREHQLTIDILNYINGNNFDSKRINAFMPILVKMVRYHIEKEEDEMFLLSDKIFTEKELDDMNTALEHMRNVHRTRIRITRVADEFV